MKSNYSNENKFSGIYRGFVVYNEDPLNTTSREEIQLGISSMLAEMDNTGVDSNE